MRPSIRRQFALIFIGLMAGTILMCWLINNIFLGEYYTTTKRNVIYDAYETIAQATGSETYSSEAFQKELDNICRMYSITVAIIDINSQTRYLSENGGDYLENKLIGYIFGFQPVDLQVLEEGEDYRIQKTGPAGNQSLEMYGRLDSGISFILSTPMESIQESACQAVCDT